MKSEKNILLLILFSTQFLSLNAQSGKEMLDSTLIRVVYNVQQKVLKEGEAFHVPDTMALDIGNTWSKYYDIHKKSRDSIAEADFKNNPPKRFSLSFDQDALADRLEARRNATSVLDESKGESMSIFKNRNTNKIITFDNGPLEGFDTFTNFKLTEEIPPQNWEITNDTLSVLGYDCRKAVAPFRGRTFNAWFTLDIPVNEGPWKLYGLPGLILKAKDDEHIFIFEAIGLQTKINEKIDFPTDKKVVPCESQKKLNQFRANRFKNISIGFSDGKGGMDYFNTKNPIEYPEIENE